ncbi:MAG: radical SAM protein [Chloroflexi bacterium]|nr:radical SAM protein [Chloroflexota bacterium]
MNTHPWWARLRAEVQSWLEPAPSPPEPGLYTYRITPEEGERRIHLRVQPEGHGALFIDVTDVIHLNATATEIAKLALDEVPAAEARARMAQRYADLDGDDAQLASDVTKIHEMVATLRAPEGGCRICAVADRVDFRPLFSAPANTPYKVDVALTYACNNACPHCYNPAERFAMSTLSLEDWRRVFDKLNEIGVPHVILTGGEPTLHPDLPEIIRYADAQGQIVGMNTNGRRLARPDLMSTLAEAGLNHVQITLESCRAAEHNAMVGLPGSQAFAETVQGIENALESGIHTITNTTLTRQNQAHAVEVVDFMHDLGVRTFAMNGMIYAGGGLSAPDAIPAEEMAPLLIRVHERAEALGMRFLWYTVTEYCRFSPVELGLDPKRCNAAEYSMCIEPNGDVIPCQSYYVTAGNILTDPWDEIWNSALFRSFRDREEDPEAAGLPRKCWDCPDLPMCGGGCRLEREAQQIGAPERGCGRAGARVPQATQAVQS